MVKINRHDLTQSILKEATLARKDAEIFYGFHVNHGIDKPL